MFGIGFDVAVTKFYDSWNKGVRGTQCFHASNVIEVIVIFFQKQWKDIRSRYVTED